MRLGYEERKMIMDRFGVDRLYSYSRLSTYLNSAWEYRMLYLEKKPRTDNVYTVWGQIGHDIIQGLYEGTYKYEEMIEEFDKRTLDWRMNSEHKFMSENVEAGYIKNLRDYFQTTEVVPFEVKNEKPVCIHIKDEKRDKDIVFIGYVDSEYYDEDGILNIVDYKSSSKGEYSGSKLKNHAKQLMLYAIGINQFRKIPFDKIRLRFDMMKYYNVEYIQKNGKTAVSKQERCKWVGGMVAKLRKDLAETGLDPFEVDEIIENAVDTNTLTGIPQEIKDKFKLKNCYIDVMITEEEANEMKQFICDVIDEIEEKEKIDWDISFPEEEITAKNEFYFTQLSGMLKYHKGYQEQQKMLKSDSEIADEDLLALFN